MGRIFYYTGGVYNYTKAEYNKLKSEEEIEFFRKNKERVHLNNAKKYNNEFRIQGGEEETYTVQKIYIDEIISLTPTNTEYAKNRIKELIGFYKEIK